MLAAGIPFLLGGKRLQSAANTLTVSVTRERPVIVSFFGSIGFGRVGVPERATSNGLCIASMLDLATTKMAVVQQRAEAKDYLDIHAILKSGVSLEEALGAAGAIFETQFNPAITLKALTFFEDGDLPSLPEEVRRFLEMNAAGVRSIPSRKRASRILAEEGSAGAA